MMKWINKARKELTNYSDETKLWIVLMTAIVMLVGLSSCSVHEPLPGLCYTEKTGSYMCNEDKSPYVGEQDMEELQPIYDKCKEFEHDGETWLDCMMFRPHNTTETNTLTYQPITIWSSVGS